VKRDWDCGIHTAGVESLMEKVSVRGRQVEPCVRPKCDEKSKKRAERRNLGITCLEFSQS
jgi:hypothetical protein